MPCPKWLCTSCIAVNQTPPEVIVVDLDKADKAVQGFVKQTDPRWRRGSPRISRNMVLQPATLKFLVRPDGCEEDLTWQQLSESVASLADLVIAETNYEPDARETFRLATSQGHQKTPLTEAAAAAMRLRLELAVWDGDVDVVRALLQEWPCLAASSTIERRDSASFSSDSEEEDRQSGGSAQPAFGLAIKLRRLEIVHCLLEAGADMLAADRDGWRLEAHLPRAFPEADVLLAQAHELVGRQAWISWKERSLEIAERLRGLPDCDLTLSWAFSTWVPAIGRLLPQDKVRLRKLGARLRLDYTLKSFSGLSWEHGHCSVLACPDKDGAVYFLDHELEKIDNLERKLLRTDRTVQDRARKQRVRSLKRGHLTSDKVTFEDTGQTAACGDFKNCKVHELSGLEYTTLVLPRLAGTRGKESGSRWKALVHFVKQLQGEAGSSTSDANADVLKFEAIFPDCEQAGHHATAEALPPSGIANVRRINANVLMSADFPLTLEQFVAIADALSVPDERYKTIKEFFEFLKYAPPDGFPVQFTIPVIPALSATLSFTEARLCDQDPALFEVPGGFVQAIGKSDASGPPAASARVSSEVARAPRLFSQAVSN